MKQYEHSSLITRVKTTQKVVAITFDDGPNPYYTPLLLEFFREYNVKATFYMIGQQIEAHGETAIAVHAAGHEIGNHTYSHPHLPELGREQQLSELVKAEELMVKITGSKPLTCRPPYLEFDEPLITLMESLDYRIVSALNLETEDWRDPGPGLDRILNKTRDHIVPGSILLFHDGFGDRSQTMEAVEILVKEYTKQGYQFVTVSDLLKLAQS